MKYITLLFLFPFLFSCNQNSLQKEPKEKIEIVTTTWMIEDLVKNIGKEKIITHCLIPQEVDPHCFELTKKDVDLFDQADLIVANGLMLEKHATFSKCFASYPSVMVLAQALPHDRLIHYNKGEDPHIWMDISLWKELVYPLCQKISMIDPKNQRFYEENAKKYFETLELTHERIKKKLSSIPPHKRYLVTSHDAFAYFARAYLTDDSKSWKEHLRAIQGFNEEMQIHYSQLVDIFSYLDKYEVNVIFLEAFLSDLSVKKILKERKGVTVAQSTLYGDAIDENVSGYIDMMEKNALAIYGELQ